MNFTRGRLFILLLCWCSLAVAAQSSPPQKPEQVIQPAYALMTEVEAVLNIARGELGYKEHSDGTTKYGIWVGDPKAQWCAEFLCWTVDQADQQMGTTLLNELYPFYQGTNTGRDWFIKQGRYIARKGFIPGWGSQWYTDSQDRMERNSYIPQPGDWMFLSYSSSGDTAHVAMVESCYSLPDGSIEVGVIEGNNPTHVARARYPLDDWRILGYGTVRDLADVTMRMGHEGQKVKSLQEKLHFIGLLKQEDTAGFYNQRTSDALKEFQSMALIKNNGIANQVTQLALKDFAQRWLMEHNELWVVDNES
ncbi:MAG: CHAP domain-containing protein [Clostridiales bacterium]|nr:CHAP domain-containing protein [Clostridiales bacterium]